MRGLGALLALALVLAAPAVGAQEPADLLLDRAQGKADAAQADPVGYAEDQASQEGIRRDARWTVAWTCFALDDVSHETGAPLPRPEQCRDYEDALGIQHDDEPQAPEDAAVAEPLEDDVVADAEDLVEDAALAVADVLEDPESAPEVLLRFVDRVVTFIGNLLSDLPGAAASVVLGAADLAATCGRTLVAAGAGLLGAVESAAGAVVGGVGSFVGGLVGLLSEGFDLTVDGVSAFAGAVASLGTGFVDAASSAAKTVVGAIGAAAAAVAVAASEAADGAATIVVSVSEGLVDAALSVAQTIGDALASLVPGGAGPKEAAPGSDAIGQAKDGAGGVLDDLLPDLPL